MATSLNAFGTIVVILLTACMCDATEEQKIGKCPVEQHLISSQQCEIKFVKKLQSNRTANCSVEFKGFVDCVVEVTRQCFSGLSLDPMSQAILNLTLVTVREEQLKLTDLFCGNGPYQMPQEIQQNITEFKKACGDDIATKYGDCGEPFIKQLRKDWTSSNMCRLNAEANQCGRKIIEACNVGEELKGYKEAMLKHYGKHYNPWCPSAKDPKEFTTGGNAAGTLSMHWLLLSATIVGSSTLLMSP